jgi:hypothetical protein
MQKFEIVIGMNDEDVDEGAAEMAIQIERHLADKFSMVQFECKHSEAPTPDPDAQPVKFDTLEEFWEHQRRLAERSMQALITVGLPRKSGVVQEWMRLQKSQVSSTLSPELLLKLYERRKLTEPFDRAFDALLSLRGDLDAAVTAVENLCDALDAARKPELNTR